MIAIREYPVKPTGNRKPGANFGKGECTANAYNTAQYPCSKKYSWRTCLLCHYCRAAENTNANYQANYDHGKIKKAKFWFYAHAILNLFGMSENT